MHVLYRFTDPLGIADDYIIETDNSDRYLEDDGDSPFQRICDRLYLLIRTMRYPVFHDPTLHHVEVVVTRYDPLDMSPIKRAARGVVAMESLTRSAQLLPCIYVADANFIRELVARGNPPLSLDLNFDGTL